MPGSPLATDHPLVPEWVGDKARVLVLNRQDMISPPVRDLWTEWFAAQGSNVYFTNAKLGKGIKVLAAAAAAAGGRDEPKKAQSGNATSSGARSGDRVSQCGQVSID